MTTETISQRFSLDEEASRKIISSPRTIIKNTGILNDLKLNKTERMANAERVLNKRRCK
ncbi:hypothetical protein [Rossellomorea aquimaris]|uniref:Uncharacterized protein n=1 Tax=Rossellomorea aquimaris TaxID=189382 RepID=A0A366EUW5_9BACI|nr:hypothetical protein [Rossellomorea aquimaris]RBP06177.1 hypothetical protein DET59_103309 [Rossellomorea aquimaris]